MADQYVALVDADSLLQSHAFASEAYDQDFFEIWERFQEWIEEHLFWADRAVWFTSCPRDKGIRRAFHPGYKLNRAKARPLPEIYPRYKAGLEEVGRCISHPRLEADDLIGMALGELASRTEDKEIPVVVSIDKDLRQFPGYLLNPLKDRFPQKITEAEALRSLATQMLTGDSSDGLPGVPGIGPKKAERILDKFPPPAQNVFTAVLATYDSEGVSPEATAHSVFGVALLGSPFMADLYKSWACRQLPRSLTLEGHKDFARVFEAGMTLVKETI